ncbi:methanogenesis marker 5 protein [Methanobrevibacter boviskoreani]|uniref:methanogenesis marker 5 protein n=1 Tax=Methanobrevibacter boviskoreani TaxID=1348249 RepID=UPI0023A86E45|nr:methanogenesis marker 5 protein [Methanobrevibacter boviskoreani]MCI6929788.1 methanogenesis marker 5 protein [Methanobrevibacter boviskoreani]MDD6257593.1 methanogenesis marker 5 protein [Methanobrevibacter boviskoreani]
MKVAVIPDSAMILINQVNKSNHQLLSHYNDIQKEKDFQKQNKEIKKGDLNKSSEKSIDYMPDLKPTRGIKYSGIELPSGVLGRMSVHGPIIEEADAVIMLSGNNNNHMYNTLNELILFGGNGCVNTRRLMEHLIRKENIPFLKLEYPNSREEIINIIYEINNFLDYLTDLETSKTNKPYIKKYIPSKNKGNSFNLEEFNNILKNSDK